MRGGKFVSADRLKLPLLPVMVTYVGWKLTLTLSLLVLVDALLTAAVVRSFQPQAD